MPRHGWPAAQTTLLTELWAKGETAVAIGGRLGLSRSAVLGKIFRLRLNTEKLANPNGGGRRKMASRDNKSATAKNSHADESPARRRRSRRQALIANIPVYGGRPIPLLELTNKSCRWPLQRGGTYLFCGALEADLEGGIPYCARHMRRAYCTAPAIFIAAKYRARAA
jgi:GcrA cell cycle regulator